MKYIKLLYKQFSEQKKTAHKSSVYAQIKRDKTIAVKLQTKDAFVRSIQSLDGKEARNISAI